MDQTGGKAGRLSWERTIVPLGDHTVYAECGPMRMFIEGADAGGPRVDLCMEAGERAIGALEEIAAARTALKRPFRQVEEPPPGTPTHEMWRAVVLVGDSDLTPMAAVAGTIADATADFLAERGLTRIVVNNGGDVSIRLKALESLNVGIRPDVSRLDITHSIRVTADTAIGGICTSGLGGRSLSRGVASAATVLASRASVADAAATAVANATYVPGHAVRRVAADLLDPETDLKGVEVTQFVGDLTCEETERALAQGISRAEALVDRGVIYGACVAVKGRMVWTSALFGAVELL